VKSNQVSPRAGWAWQTPRRTQASQAASQGRLAWLRRRPWLAGIFVLLLIGLVAGSVWLIQRNQPTSGEAPEAARVLALQANMPFQILIPAYLPGEFDRKGVTIAVNEFGPSGEPMVQLAYQARNGAILFVRQWVPANPTMEVLANSRPIETKWGNGWLLTQDSSEGSSLAAIWTDVGPLRASVYSPSMALLKKEQLLAMADSLGPPSNQQVFNFVVNPPAIKDVPPPAPVKIETNAQGIQELTLVITPGGYSPLRFAVKKGVPVRLIFRQLGQVGCGNELLFATGPNETRELKLKTADDKAVLEFTPQEAGQFEFHCSHQMYRGIMTVTP
jgi:hypothetical protein